MFARATCANCDYIAVRASDCVGCHKIICGHCLKTDSTKQCRVCQTKFTGATDLHPMVGEMFERATFKCVYKCGEDAINLSVYERHISEECQHRVLACPNKCGDALKAYELDHHLDSCPNELVPCNACQLIRVKRHELKRHLQFECPKG